MLPMKHCPHCQTEKPESEYSQQKAVKDGLCTYCKPCNSQRTKLWHQLNPGVNDELKKQYYHDHPEKLKAFYDRRAADPLRIQRRKEEQARNKKRRLAEAKGKALRLWPKWEG